MTPETELGEATSGGEHRVLVIALVTFVGLIGLALRLWGLGRAPINADEAIVALMAHEILHGHFFAFFWGQRYGGGEPYVVALVFAIFGQSSFTLGLSPLLLDTAAAVLVWRIGRRLFSNQIGVVAALLFWIWPEVYIQLSTIEWGFRWLVLDCGLVLFLTALRISDRDPARKHSVVAHLDWILIGLALGVGWWGSPEIAYSAVPAAALLASRGLRRRLAATLFDPLAAILAALFGALPWLWANVRNHFRSIHEHKHSFSIYVSHLRILGIHAFPMLLGLRLRLSGRWIVSPLFGELLYTLALVALALVLVALLIAKRARVLVVFALVAPIVFAIAPTDYWGDGRYAVFLAPVVALLVVAGIDGLWRTATSSLGARTRSAKSPSWVLALALVGGLALSLGAMVQITPYRPSALVPAQHNWAEWHADPNSWLDPVLRSLDAAHVSDVYAGYWVGTVLIFESHERIAATDIPSIRYRPFTEAVEASPTAAWIILRAGQRAEAVAEASTALDSVGCTLDKRGCLPAGTLEAFLVHTHNPFRSEIAGSFLEIFPDRPIVVRALLAYWH